MASFKFIIITTSVIYLALLLFIKVYFILVGEGLGVPIFNHYPGKCRVIPGLECGSEDFAVTDDGLVFISNGLRAFPKCDYSLNKGGIYLFDFNKPSSNVSRLEVISETINFDQLDPHGMTLWEYPESQKISLFVVDHGHGDDVVFVFEYDKAEPTKLLHKKTIKDSTFVCLNDLVATGPLSFYTTNYIAYCKSSSLAIALEFFFQAKTGNVVYFDGEKGRVLKSGFAMSNGINMSPNGKYVYVALSSYRDLLIFKRDVKTHDIQLIKELHLASSPDNVEVDKDTGDIYIGAHKNYMLPFGSYNGSFAAPSHVLRLHCLNENWDQCSTTELLSSDGIDFVRGSSVAHFHKGGLLIGTVYHKLAFCHDVKLHDYPVEY